MNEDKFKLTVYISKENSKKLGYLAVDMNETRSDLVDQILTEYFKAKGK